MQHVHTAYTYSISPYHSTSDVGSENSIFYRVARVLCVKLLDGIGKMGIAMFFC